MMNCCLIFLNPSCLFLHRATDRASLFVLTCFEQSAADILCARRSVWCSWLRTRRSCRGTRPGGWCVQAAPQNTVQTARSRSGPSATWLRLKEQNKNVTALITLKAAPPDSCWSEFQSCVFLLTHQHTSDFIQLWHILMIKNKTSPLFFSSLQNKSKKKGICSWMLCFTLFSKNASTTNVIYELQTHSLLLLIKSAWWSPTFCCFTHFFAPPSGFDWHCLKENKSLQL